VVFSDVSVPENLFRAKAAIEAFQTTVRDPCDPVEDRHDLVSERFARFRTLCDQLARAAEPTAF
jgi:hypothetical protein